MLGFIREDMNQYRILRKIIQKVKQREKNNLKSLQPVATSLLLQFFHRRPDRLVNPTPNLLTANYKLCVLGATGPLLRLGEAPQTRPQTSQEARVLRFQSWRVILGFFFRPHNNLESELSNCPGSERWGLPYHQPLSFSQNSVLLTHCCEKVHENKRKKVKENKRNWKILAEDDDRF